MNYPNNDFRNYLAHHGVKGQRWGVRRWQFLDGSLTPAGLARYSRDNMEYSRRAVYDTGGILIL